MQLGILRAKKAISQINDPARDFEKLFSFANYTLLPPRKGRNHATMKGHTLKIIRVFTDKLMTLALLLIINCLNVL